MIRAFQERDRPAVWALGEHVVGTVPGGFRRPSGEYVGLHVMHLDLRTG